jgi:integrase
MTTVRRHAEDYLAMRRALGFKLSTQGRLLMDFVGHLERAGAGRVTTEIALAWATATPYSTDEVYHCRRLMVVRIFARHLRMLDPATEVPPADVLPHHYRRVVPYLFPPGEVAALVAAAGMLTPRLRGLTWPVLVGLLATTGVRVGEACRLDGPDVDPDAGVLTIRDSKFGKSREVVVHPSTARVLGGYARHRARLRPAPATAAFFVSTRGTRLDVHNLPRTFRHLLSRAGIQAPPGQRAPRLADLRHTFATTTLLDWYRAGVDVQARLPRLSTYLGHVDPKSTYWYLQATPELLALAAARLETTPGAGGGAA